ncbi:cartilage acidic protein 1-like isoform X2 [Ptychodera flava]|uniref:cartilage acidic protein 1-like isoform X2 n=1 Tax=Ptychodera flava TaxID=63121 RepID=UPI00396A37BE
MQSQGLLCSPTICITALVLWLARLTASDGMFESLTNDYLDSSSNPVQLNYGVAVSDVDNDGTMEWIVAGYSGANLVLKWDAASNKLYNIAVNDKNSPFYALRDTQGNAIGVSACDVDGDGREEIYFLNTNNAYSGYATYTDKLFKFRDGKYVDLFQDEVNKDAIRLYAGRSVACVDRKGTGRYSIVVANYASGNVGPFGLIEMVVEDSDVAAGHIVLRDVASEAGVARLTGGRGVTVGPIMNDFGLSDIFCDNERGANFLFVNQGDGSFEDVAQKSDIADRRENGRGVALTDLNGDELIDIVYGNWEGPHRIYIQEKNGEDRRFRDIATAPYRNPSPIRTVIVADFDNDGNLEILQNNIVHGDYAPNHVFRVTRNETGKDPKVEEIDIGDAEEPDGFGTGGAVADLDGDGVLELMLSHGESSRQPLTMYRAKTNGDENWLRVMPKTEHGAPARGALVVARTTDNVAHLRVIDGGSGYLCQMEPVAHFGLGSAIVSRVEITWPDSQKMVKIIDKMNSVIVIEHPKNSNSSSKDTGGVLGDKLVDKELPEVKVEGELMHEESQRHKDIVHDHNDL